MLAAYGSGASRVSHDEDKRILNIDIGGGTTKLALVEKGHVIATAAVHIGGRLQVVDPQDRHIERLDPAGRYHARQAGFDWHKGDIIDPNDLDKVAEVMAGRTGRRAHAAADAACGRASLPHRSDRRFRPHRRHHVLRRRRRICLWPRDPRFRRHGPPPRPRRSAARSMPARCHGRCCPPANASAPPRSAPPNTASSSPAIPATSASPASSCRAAICRCCSRRSNARRSSMPTALAKAIRSAFHRPST